MHMHKNSERGRTNERGIMRLSEKRKREIPHKRACEGHRVHNGYTVLSLNPTPGGKITN